MNGFKKVFSLVVVFIFVTNLLQYVTVRNRIEHEGARVLKSWSTSSEIVVGCKSRHNHSTTFILSPVFNFNTICDHSCRIRKDFNWTMVTFIKSAANNFQRRLFLRKTWASIRYTSSGRFRYVFVIGRPDSERTFSLIEEEWARYQDILMYNGSDGYRDIARKTLAGMQWASENLPPSYFYSSSDDDFMLDVAILQDVVNENILKVHERNWPDFPFVCTFALLVQRHVVRDNRYKEYVPYDEYPWHEYPRSCLGGFYTTSVSLISKVWKFSNFEHLVRMDDVWITGILRQKLGVPDYAVVDPETKAAAHFFGFRGHGSPRSKTFMEDEWDQFYHSISQQPHCICQ